MGDLPPVDVAVSPGEKFREFLSTRGMRLTAERETIVNEIFSSHEHFDPEQLILRLTQQQNPRRVSRASVYRTLTLLEESGIIRRVARANDREVYEHDYGYPQHDHFICSECNALIEFQNSAISHIVDELGTSHGFRVSGHRLEVYGVCADCSRPRRHSRLDMV